MSNTDFPDVSLQPVFHDPFADMNTKLGEMNRNAFGPLAGPTTNLMAEPGVQTGRLTGGAAASPLAPKPLSPLQQQAMERSAAHEDDRISTRIPTAGGQAVSDAAHANNDLIIDTPAMAAQPSTMERNAAIVRGYGGHDIPEELGAADTLQAFKQHLKSNILAIHDGMAPQDRERAGFWYDGANGITHDWANEFTLHPRQVAGVIASQSPQKDWYQNVSLGRRIIETHQNQQDATLTPEMTAWGQRYTDRLAAAGKPGAAVAQSFLDRNQGVPYSQMNDIDRAHFIRFHDEVNNDRGYDILSPEGTVVGPALNQDGVTPSKVGWGSMDDIAKGAAVLRDGSRENISAQMGGAHKVRNFYNNIIAPYSDKGDVTVDTHAIAGANIFPYTGSDKVTTQGLGQGGSYAGISGSSGLYPVYADAYREAAAERGILPRQMQSRVWEGARGLFPAEQKALTSYRDGIEIPWVEHESGTRTLPQAQQGAIEAAGGIRRPDWAEPAVAGNAAPGNPANAGELPGRGLPGRRPGAIARRAGATAAASPAAPGLTEEPAFGDPFSYPSP
jgi:hypothetical protein